MTAGRTLKQTAVAVKGLFWFLVSTIDLNCVTIHLVLKVWVTAPGVGDAGGDVVAAARLITLRLEGQTWRDVKSTSV